ncbi:MAG: cell division protein FtsA [Erysipelotrichaceae bacterium]|nr:cell division protein FtsA [Erysipelotrichaceae bacterium]
MDKQIFAAIEVVSHEVRLIVGEFFNTRFNIIKVERVTCSGFDGMRVTDPEAVSGAIEQAVYNASKSIEARIKRTILCIPSNNMQRYPLKSTVPVESIDGVCTVEDVKNAVGNARKTQIDSSLAMIQAVPTRYTVNGISYRKMPTNELCDHLTVSTDLFCVDKDMAYALVSCVENAGIEVMDICIDMFAIAKEAALFEQTVNHNIIVLKLERSGTTLALISQGVLVACAMLESGMTSMINKLCTDHGIPTETSARLLKYNTRLNLEEYTDDPVYIWGAADGSTSMLSEKQLIQSVSGAVREWLDSVKSACEPILQAGETTVIITGEGGELQGLDALLSDTLGVDAKNYIPETLGVRDASLTSCLGLFYAYKDQLPITGYTDNSVDMDQFRKVVNYREHKPSDPNESMTKKLKGMLFEAKK